MKKIKITYFVGLVLLSGCSVVPTVEYSKITAPSDLTGDEIDSFYLSKSIIKIDKVGTEKDSQDKEIDKLVISSTPVESTEFKISIRKADSIGVETNINIKKLENTALIQEVGTEVTDNRVEMIERIGTIITGAAALAFSNTELEQKALPKRINVSVLLNNLNVGRSKKNGIDAAEGVTIDFGAIPQDAVSIDEFSEPMKMSGLIYSACRDAKVKFIYKNNKFEKNVKVSDPRFFQTIAFPVKGKITFHSECGVSVLSEKETGVKTNTEIINALIVQGKAIKDAIDAAKKDD
jgi:hypothetical protein